MGLAGKQNKYRLTCGVLAGVLAVGLYAEQSKYEAGRQTLMQVSDISKVEMRPAPINKDWIIEGNPKTEVGEVAHTYDNSTQVYIWRTTASKFTWHYDVDEVVTILDGEVFITDTDGKTRDLKAGDVALFPVGAVLTWNVPDHVTKSAIIKHTMPKPFETAVRWLRSFKGMVAPEKAFAG